MNLIIDGLEISDLSALGIKQTFAPVNNGSLLRMADGTAVKQKVWGKLKTTISAMGWIPDGLSGINFDNSVTVDCIAQRSIVSSSNAIAIPGTVRPDADPWGIALVNGQWQDVGSTFASGTLTIDVTAGATQYQARWMPRLTLYCNEPETETDSEGNVFNWSITGEEV